MSNQKKIYQGTPTVHLWKPTVCYRLSRKKFYKLTAFPFQRPFFSNFEKFTKINTFALVLFFEFLLLVAKTGNLGGSLKGLLHRQHSWWHLFLFFIYESYTNVSKKNFAD